MVVSNAHIVEGVEPVAFYVARVDSALQAVANPANAIPMARYMRDQFLFLGVKTPERRKATKAIVSELAKTSASRTEESIVNWDVVHALWDRQAREFQYVACDYLSKVKPMPSADVVRLRELITSKSWWDTVDALSTVVGSAFVAGTVEKQLILAWARDENLWVRRVAVICQRRLREDTDTELLETVIRENLGSEEFFINKAIGWALRDFSKTNPAWVKGFLHSYGKELSALSIREGSKYVDLT